MKPNTTTLLLRTKARATADGLASHFHAHGVLLGEVRPEARPAMQLNFVSLAHVRDFCAEMAIEDVQVLAAPHEDAAALLAQVRAGPATLH